MYTEWPGIYSYDELNDRLFVKPGRNDNINDTPSKARYYSAEHREWQSQQMFMAYYIGAQLSQVSLTMKKTLANFEEDLAEEQHEIDEHKGSSGHQIKRWKTKQGVYQLKAPVAVDQAEFTLKTLLMQKCFVMFERKKWDTLRWIMIFCLRRTHERGFERCIRLRFTVSPPAISNFFWGGFCGLFVFVFFVWFWLLCLFWFPRLRDPPSSFTQLNDRLSCHGAHGMGEKKSCNVRFCSKIFANDFHAP